MRAGYLGLCDRFGIKSLNLLGAKRAQRRVGSQLDRSTFHSMAGPVRRTFKFVSQRINDQLS